LKLFGAHPRYVWKRTTNDVVSLPQMQSSGGTDDKSRPKRRSPATTLHADLMGATSPSPSTPYIATRRIREFE
jgi:hypothetical protein